MEQSLLEYLKRIDLYEFKKMHGLQIAARNYLRTHEESPQKTELISQIAPQVDASTTHARFVIDNMACLDNDKQGGIFFQNDVITSLSKGDLDKRCSSCGFGPNGDTRSGCALLLRMLYTNRKDMRMTRYDPSHGLATHYGIDEARETGKLSVSLAPTIEFAILEHTARSTYNPADRHLWSNILANHLWQPFVRDLGKHLKLDRVGDRYGYFSELNIKLGGEYGKIPETIRNSPWLPMIREFGIFALVSNFLHTSYSQFKISQQGFKDGKEIYEHTRNYYFTKTTNPKTGETIHSDDFRAYHELKDNGEIIKAPVMCPGRTVALATSLCHLYNLDLRVKNKFSASDSFVNLVYFDNQGNYHLLRPSEMEEQYTNIVSC